VLTQHEPLQVLTGNAARTALTIEHKRVHQAPLRIITFVHDSFLQAPYSGICSAEGEMITPLLSA